MIYCTFVFTEAISFALQHNKIAYKMQENLAHPPHFQKKIAKCKQN